MKSIKTIFASVILVTLFSVSAFAGNGAKVIAVINRADWCPVCQKNGMRAMETFKENNKDMAIVFVANDLTNDQTKKQSSEELKKYGLDKAAKKYTATGVVHFFNPETKKEINEISVAKPNNELIAALETAKKGLE